MVRWMFGAVVVLVAVPTLIYFFAATELDDVRACEQQSIERVQQKDRPNWIRLCMNDKGYEVLAQPPWCAELDRMAVDITCYKASDVWARARSEIRSIAFRLRYGSGQEGFDRFFREQGIEGGRIPSQ